MIDYKSLTEKDWQDFINTFKSRAESPEDTCGVIDISKPITPEEVLDKLNEIMNKEEGSEDE